MTTSSNPPVRIAVQLQPIHCDYAALRSAVARIDSSGTDILLASDHFFPVIGNQNGSCFEAWTLLAAWAAETKRVKLGVSVSSSTYRNAHLMADMARTIDHISGGRAILGIGSGWFRRDYDEYEYPFPSPVDRISGLEQALRDIHYRLDRLNPPPVQEKLPIMVGNGGDRKPPEMVALQADIWLDFQNLEEVAKYNSELDAACDVAGRDPARIERGVCLPSSELSNVDAWRTAGCSLFMLRTQGPGFELPELSEWLAWRDHCNHDRATTPPRV